ncbi:MAG: MBL fold metallo-hydrolase [Planctomycetota bacterium]
MIFQQFFEPGLAQYSYIVGCSASKEIAIVDPRRDVDLYIRFANQRGLEIRFVLETHIHADFASGAHELAHLTGADLFRTSGRQPIFFGINPVRDVAYPGSQPRAHLLPGVRRDAVCGYPPAHAVGRFPSRRFGGPARYPG